MEGLGFIGVWGIVFRAWGFGFKGSGFRVACLGVFGVGCRVFATRITVEDSIGCYHF